MIRRSHQKTSKGLFAVQTIIHFRQLCGMCRVALRLTLTQDRKQMIGRSHQEPIERFVHRSDYYSVSPTVWHVPRCSKIDTHSGS